VTGTGAMPSSFAYALVEFSRDFISFPVLKKGTPFCGTETEAPVLAFLPVRPSRSFTENTPKPRNSTRSPRAIAAVISAKNDIDDLLGVLPIAMRGLE
jgi:hypothetical protein